MQKPAKQKFERKPFHDVKTFISADGKYIVQKFVTTWITPIKYFSKILEGKGSALPLFEFAASGGPNPSTGEGNDRSD